jgi:hypothetical protein
MGDRGTTLSAAVDGRQLNSLDLNELFDLRLRTSRERIGRAIATATHHRPEGGMCSCYRPLPCGVQAVLEQQHTASEASIAALLGPTQVMPLPAAAPHRMADARAERVPWWRIASRRRNITGGPE